MVGVIRKRDIISHPLVTVQCFGWRVFFKALLAGQDQTFLSLLTDSGTFQSQKSQIPEYVESCIQLELRAKRLYWHLARKFSQASVVRIFFTTLARQEQEHADLLQLCREAAGRGQWIARYFEPYAKKMSQLENGMQETESRLERLRTIADALRLVIRIESSEVNDVFQSIVSASDSKFVRSFGLFHTSIGKHLHYINSNILKIDPDLKDDCKVLQDKIHARAEQS